MVPGWTGLGRKCTRLSHYSGTLLLIKASLVELELTGLPTAHCRIYTASCNCRVVKRDAAALQNY